MLEGFTGCTLGPFSAVYVLGLVGAALFLPLLGLQLGMTLGIGVAPGYFTAPDKVTAAITATLLSLYLVLLIYMNLWSKLEVFFFSLPWLRHNGKMQGIQGTRKYATRCPFTGHRTTMRCPSCQVRVHDAAFHKSDHLVMFFVGKTVLRWDGAKQAPEMEGSVKKARQCLDQYLDFRRNALFASLTAKALHVFSDVLAVMYAQAALMVQLHTLLRTNDLLMKYRPMVPSLEPLFRMPSSRLKSHLLRAPWEQAV